MEEKNILDEKQENREPGLLESDGDRQASGGDAQGSLTDKSPSSSKKKVKSSSLQQKIQFTVILVTTVSIVVTTVFSLLYFYSVVRREVKENMDSNRLVSLLIFREKEKEVTFFAENLSNSRTLQVLLNYDIRNKLSTYLKEIVEREKVYNITVFNTQKQIVSNVGAEKSLLVVTERSYYTDLTDQLAAAALQGEKIHTIEIIHKEIGEHYDIFSLTSCVPIIRDNQIIGGLIVRYVLNEQLEVLTTIRNNLKVHTGIFVEGKGIAATDSSLSVSDSIYKLLMEEEPYHEKTRMWFNSNIAQYITLYDYLNKPVGVLGIYIDANKYMDDFVNAFVFALILMILLMAGFTFGAGRIARTIVGPLNYLMDGVNKITNGDLTHEIVLNLRDEIGRLSRAFNQMRMSLREKIGTIETMNKNLENTVQKRTATIESLLNKMKKYLSPQLYDSIIGSDKNEEITHARKKLTIFFSDIKDFTQTTDSLESEELSEFLNNYLDEMAKIALNWGGTIDKFVGDAIMVFFGDPEFIDDQTHALRAVKMAIEMQDRLVELREEWNQRGFARGFHIRMGVNTGYCTVGNFGSENRMDYTIIGGQVNLAQRLEAAAPVDGILISHETYALVSDQISCNYMGEIKVKGIHMPVKTYRVLSMMGEEERYKKYFRRTDGGLVLKTIKIDSDLDNEAREHVIKALKVAAKYAISQGEKLKKQEDEKKES